MTSRVAAFLGCLLFGATGCTEQSAVLAIVTDSAAFSRVPNGGAQVGFTVTNVSADTLGMVACGSRIMAVLDQQVGNTWVTVSSDACLGPHTQEAFRLSPGESAAGVRVVLDQGVWRLGVTALSGPSSLRIASPPFTVR